MYTVDASVGTGHLPMRVAGDTGDGQVDDYPILTTGQSVTIRGFTITVQAADDSTRTVKISRAQSEQTDGAVAPDADPATAT